MNFAFMASAHVVYCEVFNKWGGGGLVLFGMTRRKGHVGGEFNFFLIATSFFEKTPSSSFLIML